MSNREVAMPAEANAEKNPRRLSMMRHHLMSMVLAISMAIGMAESAAGQFGEWHAEPDAAADKDTSREQLETKRKENARAFREIVELDTIREKIAQLREKFGGSIDALLIMRRIERDLELLDRLQQAAQDPHAYVSEPNPFFMTPGSMVSSAYEERWKRHEVFERETAVHGMEGVKGLNSDEFLIAMRGEYPDGYIDNAVANVTFNPEKDIRGNTQVLGRAEQYDMAKLAQTNDERSSITINETVQGVTAEDVKEVFRHEVHHPNDWQNSPVLTSAQRIDLLWAVTQRLDAPDRYKSEYVERIDANSLPNRLDKLPEGTSTSQFVAFVKASEYWPEIAMQYFKDPEKFKITNEKDWALVDAWVRVISGK